MSVFVKTSPINQFLVPRPPKFSGGHGRSVTHDGRTTTPRKLSPEEVNQMKDEVSTDYVTIGVCTLYLCLGVIIFNASTSLTRWSIGPCSIFRTWNRSGCPKWQVNSTNWWFRQLKRVELFSMTLKKPMAMSPNLRWSARTLKNSAFSSQRTTSPYWSITWSHRLLTRRRKKSGSRWRNSFTLWPIKSSVFTLRSRKFFRFMTRHKSSFKIEKIRR